MRKILLKSTKEVIVNNITQEKNYVFLHIKNIVYNPYNKYVVNGSYYYETIDDQDNNQLAKTHTIKYISIPMTVEQVDGIE
jgi:hypothetical protein